MKKKYKFNFHTLKELEKKIKRMGLDIPISENVDILKQPVKIGGITAPNRMIIHPMEGADGKASNGAPDKLTFRRYVRLGKSGAGLFWFEATAVVPDGRANPRQLWINRDNVGDFKELLVATKNSVRESMGDDFKPVYILQLTHSGRYSRPLDKPLPVIAHHSEVLDPLHKLPADYPLISDKALYELQKDFVQAAKLAAMAGFDGVDIKSCHCYLISELLASFTRTKSEFGGSFENRTRFLRTTAQLINKEVPEIFTCTRLNCFDAIKYPYGFGVHKDDCKKPDLTEPKKLIDFLKRQGFPIINTTIGNPYFNPHFGRPYDIPITKVPVQSDEHPLVSIERFLKITGSLQKAFPGIPLVGSGYTWLRHLFPYVAAGIIQRGEASLVGLGRGAFAYPEFAKDILQKGWLEKDKCCIACSCCTQIMRDDGRTGCVIMDKEVYGPIYREHRQISMDFGMDEAAQCLECFNPTCSKGCPASVDVPGFLKRFAKGDIKAAYNILRKNNVLP
ncbi:MAG: hypothetical protein AB1633_10740, partial [Elusimicrobiota bacterium]